MRLPSDWVRTRSPRWDVEGRDWPFRDASTFVEVNGLRWHVQMLGDGPKVLLLHGAGAASHSFRGIIPYLAGRFSIVVPDLPGHGFTVVPSGFGLGLHEMADALAALLRRLEIRPRIVIGHSAGAAIAARMLLDDGLSSPPLIGINAALLPLSGFASVIFSPLARAIVASRIGPDLLAWSSSHDMRIRKTIEGTGSTLDPRGYELYARLVGCPGHVEGTVRMMSAWDLDPLVSDLPKLKVPLLLLAGERDRAVPPNNAQRVAERVKGARVIRMRGVGHLSHEEDPAATADLIHTAADRWAQAD